MAVLLGRPGAGAPVTVRATETYDGDPPAACSAHPGSVRGLFDLAAAHRLLLRDGGTHVLVTEPGTPAFLLDAERLPERIETETHAHQ